MSEPTPDRDAVEEDPPAGPPDPPSRAGHLLRRAWPYVRFVIGLGGAALVVWVLSSHTDELSGLSSIFGHMAWGWLLPAVALEGASFLSLAFAQRRLLEIGAVTPPLGTLSLFTLASQAIINSLPGGYAVASVYGFRWFRRFGASDSLALWSLAATVVVGIISLSLVAAAGLALAASYGASLDLVPVTIGVLLVTLAMGVLFLYHRPQHAVASLLIRSSRRVTGRELRRLEERTGRFLAQISAYRPAPRDVVWCLWWGIGNWIFDCGCFACSFLAIGSSIPWKGLLLSYGAGQLAANLPITPGGLGVVEGSITIALVAFGGNRLSTVEAVLIYRLISFWAQLVIGWGSAGWLALAVRSGRWRREARPGRAPFAMLSPAPAPRAPREAREG